MIRVKTENGAHPFPQIYLPTSHGPHTPLSPYYATTPMIFQSAMQLPFRGYESNLSNGGPSGQDLHSQFDLKT